MLFIYLYLSFLQLIIQVHRTCGLSYRLIHDHEIVSIHKEYRSAVCQVLVMRIFCYQHLNIPFRLPQFRNRFRSFQCTSVESQCVMHLCLAEPVAQLHHLCITCIYISTTVGEEVTSVEPEFKRAIIRLAMPFSLRTGLDHHHRSIFLPSVSESEKARSQRTVRQIRQQTALFSLSRIVADPLAFREQLCPIYIIPYFIFPVTQFGVTETRICIIRETDIGIKLNHLFDDIQIFYRKLTAESVHIGHPKSLAENIDGCQVIMRIQFILTSVGIHLLFDFTVQNTDTALSPFCRILKFREERAGIHHALRFKKQMVALVRIILHDMFSMTVIIYQEFRQKSWGKGR